MYGLRPTMKGSERWARTLRASRCGSSRRVNSALAMRDSSDKGVVPYCVRSLIVTAGTGTIRERDGGQSAARFTRVDEGLDSSARRLLTIGWRRLCILDQPIFWNSAVIRGKSSSCRGVHGHGRGHGHGHGPSRRGGSSSSAVMAPVSSSWTTSSVNVAMCLCFLPSLLLHLEGDIRLYRPFRRRGARGWP